MLKEIYEQPEVVQKCLDRDFHGSYHIPKTCEQIHLIACGTSLHASLVGQYLFEQLAGIPTIVRSASEYLAAPFPPTPNTWTIAVTQSGETADTIAAVKLARSRQHHSAPLWAITNQADSTIAKLVDRVLVTPAGTEVGVAATKTFLAQLMTFYALALELAEHHQILQPSNISASQPMQLRADLQQLPTQIQTILQQDSAIATLAQNFQNTSSLIVLGSGINTAIALEGALKLKETTYIHAEGYAAGEFLHGPIALLDDKIPVIAIVSSKTAPTLIKTTRKAQANSSSVLGVVPSGLQLECEVCIQIPIGNELLSPILNIVPLQLLAYHIAKLRNLEIDRPRSLTKSLSG